MSSKKKDPKENYQYQRNMSIAEIKAIRNWLDVGKHRKPSWDKLPEDTIVPVRLWIHEVFALAAWRKRDGGDDIRVPEITDKNKSNLIERLTKAEEFLADGQANVDTIPDGPEKEEMLKGLEYSML